MTYTTQIFSYLQLSCQKNPIPTPLLNYNLLFYDQLTRAVFQVWNHTQHLLLPNLLFVSTESSGTGRAICTICLCQSKKKQLYSQSSSLLLFRYTWNFIHVTSYSHSLMNSSSWWQRFFFSSYPWVALCDHDDW